MNNDFKIGDKVTIWLNAPLYVSYVEKINSKFITLKDNTKWIIRDYYEWGLVMDLEDRPDIYVSGNKLILILLSEID